MSIKLSANFALGEFLCSQVAARHGINMHAPAAIRRELERLCVQILQPLRDALGPVIITSGYRPERLNKMVGGSRDSQHVLGQAADIIVPGKSVLAVCQWLRDNAPCDQLIHELGEWTHVSVAPNFQKPRRQVLTAVRGPRGVAYSLGLPES